MLGLRTGPSRPGRSTARARANASPGLKNSAWSRKKRIVGQRVCIAEILVDEQVDRRLPEGNVIRRVVRHDAALPGIDRRKDARHAGCRNSTNACQALSRFSSGTGVMRSAQRTLGGVLCRLGYSCRYTMKVVRTWPRHIHLAKGPSPCRKSGCPHALGSADFAFRPRMPSGMQNFSVRKLFVAASVPLRCRLWRQNAFGTSATVRFVETALDAEIRSRLLAVVKAMCRMHHA
jgi:hypothetical protein